MTTVVTGIKPTGTPHLGNYLGMIRPALRLAEQHRAYYFIADFHALNSHPDPTDLRRHTLEAAATFLALGLDPGRTTLYRQSDVPEVFELTQALACVTPKGLMNRAHAYKATVDANRRRGLDDDIGVNMGLYTYPLLMAADILAPRADVVPVGRDQQQHLDITRDIATGFNSRYGAVLRVPAAAVDDRTMTVPGTDGRKMSKSYDNVIPILADADVVGRAVMSIVTDSRPVEEPKDPAGDTIFQLFELVGDAPAVEELRDRFLAGGLRYTDAKRQLADVVIAHFREPRRRYAELMARPMDVDETLAAGAARVRERTAGTLGLVRAAVGLD